MIRLAPPVLDESNIDGPAESGMGHEPIEYGDDDVKFHARPVWLPQRKRTGSDGPRGQPGRPDAARQREPAADPQHHQHHCSATWRSNHLGRAHLPLGGPGLALSYSSTTWTVSHLHWPSTWGSPSFYGSEGFFI